MNRHAVYPPVITTVTPRRRQLTRLAKNALTAGLLVVMVLGTVKVMAILWTLDAQLDSAFMQGMKAGHQICAREA